MRLEIHGKFKPIRENDVLFITGDGRTLPDDLRTFLGWELPHDVVAIGRSINLYSGRVGHWANVDGADSCWWAEHLPLKNEGKLPIRHTLGECRGYDVDWEIVDDVIWGKDDQVLWHGSTALFAVYIGLAMDFKKIVLGGCPLDSKGHWYFGPEYIGPRWHGECYQAWFEFARTSDADRVRSLSGYTSQIVGMAKREWLVA